MHISLTSPTTVTSFRKFMLRLSHLTNCCLIPSFKEILFDVKTKSGDDTILIFCIYNVVRTRNSHEKGFLSQPPPSNIMVRVFLLKPNRGEAAFFDAEFFDVVMMCIIQMDCVTYVLAWETKIRLAPSRFVIKILNMWCSSNPRRTVFQKLLVITLIDRNSPTYSHLIAQPSTVISTWVPAFQIIRVLLSQSWRSFTECKSCCACCLCHSWLIQHTPSPQRFDPECVIPPSGEPFSLR